MTVSREDIHPSVRLEDDRISDTAVLIVLAVTIVVAVAFSFWAVRILHDQEAAFRPSGTFEERDLKVPGEVSQVEQTYFLAETPPRTDDAQRRKLERYEWVDRAKGTLSIPVERAFDVLIQQSKKGKGP